MNPINGWLRRMNLIRTVAAAHEAGANDLTEGAVTVRRVSGGANNALYCVEVGGSEWDVYVSTHWAFLILRLLWSLYNGPDRLRQIRSRCGLGWCSSSSGPKGLFSAQA